MFAVVSVSEGVNTSGAFGLRQTCKSKMNTVKKINAREGEAAWAAWRWIKLSNSAQT